MPEKTSHIESFLEAHLTPDEPFILACSTGVDSMYLLHQILQTPHKNSVIVAHFNHKTRPECEQEEDFLQDFCKQHGLTLEVAEADFEKLQALSPSKSFEELAREKRYQFFDALCHIHGAAKVFTAHHLDDRIETMLFHMLRGTKLRGLINMREVSGNIYRPLLHTPKSEIREYMDSQSLPYFEDSSNADMEHTRNYIRHEIVPKFHQVHPEHYTHLAKLL